MAQGVTLKVWGPLALFTRPENKAERLSYDVITPSAARGILDAIYWKPGMRWVIDEITVCRPIRFISFRRNEVSGRVPHESVTSAMNGGELRGAMIEDDRQQRTAQVLCDVAYLIDAHFVLTGGGDANAAKHIDTFRRRARTGRCHHQPCFGVREFPAFFELIEGARPVTPYKKSRDLGRMLYDLDFSNPQDPQPSFFHAVMVEGVIDVRDAFRGNER